MIKRRRAEMNLMWRMKGWKKGTWVDFSPRIHLSVVCVLNMFFFCLYFFFFTFDGISDCPPGMHLLSLSDHSKSLSSRWWGQVTWFFASKCQDWRGAKSQSQHTNGRINRLWRKNLWFLLSSTSQESQSLVIFVMMMRRRWRLRSSSWNIRTFSKPDSLPTWISGWRINRQKGSLGNRDRLQGGSPL